MVCAAGLASLQALLEDGILDNASILGELFQKRLKQISIRFSNEIRCVLGKGLIAAIHFVDKDHVPLTHICDQVCEEAMRRGLLLVHTGRETIKLAPPLSINQEALLEGLQVLEDTIAEVLETVRCTA